MPLFFRLDVEYMTVYVNTDNVMALIYEMDYGCNGLVVQVSLD